MACPGFGRAEASVLSSRARSRFCAVRYRCVLCVEFSPSRLATGQRATSQARAGGRSYWRETVSWLHHTPRHKHHTTHSNRITCRDGLHTRVVAARGMTIRVVAHHSDVTCTAQHIKIARRRRHMKRRSESVGVSVRASSRGTRRRVGFVGALFASAAGHHGGDVSMRSAGAWECARVARLTIACCVVLPPLCTKEAF